MKSNVVYVADTCSVCKRDHGFHKGPKANKPGWCTYLTVQTGSNVDVKITKTTTCRFFLMDIEKVKAVKSELESENV